MDDPAETGSRITHIVTTRCDHIPMDAARSLDSKLIPRSGLAPLQNPSLDDVVITLAVRSPLCKARKGGFKDTGSDELLAAMFNAVLARSGIDPALIEDICVGNVLTPAPTYEARAAALAAGIPEATPIQVINRFCSSGLMAVTTISNQTRAGQIEIRLAVGSESMSAHLDMGSPPLNEDIMKHDVAKDTIQPMGWTSENVAEDFNISREDMDALAALSFQRAEAAQKSGVFVDEIVPFTVSRRNIETGRKEKVVVDRDDGIRAGTTKEILAKLRGAFPQWGGSKTTGGNASQITDGAAAVLLMTRQKADELGLKILAKHVTTSVAGLSPRVMGIGPTFAIPIALKKAGISIADVDIFEINEAFASMCTPDRDWSKCTCASKWQGTCYVDVYWNCLYIRKLSSRIVYKSFHGLRTDTSHATRAAEHLRVVHNTRSIMDANEGGEHSIRSLPLTILAAIVIFWYCFLWLLSILGCLTGRKNYRLRPRSPLASSSVANAPGVSVLRPLKGLDTNLFENLESTFTQEYPNFEILLSVADADDQSLTVVRSLLEKYPHVEAKVIIGEEEVGVNPKVNNLIRSYRQAKHDILWVIDSNVQVYPGTLARSVDALVTPSKPNKRRIGLVHHVPLAFASEEALGSRIEEAFLNTNHAKMYLAINRVAVDSCVVGKSNMYRRSDLERVTGNLKPLPAVENTGSTSVSASETKGLPAFGRFLAEDNMIGSALWHELGLRHDLGCDVARNSIGNMTLAMYVRRRVRWIRVRKHMTVVATLVEPFTECILLSALAAWAAHHLWDVPRWFLLLLHYPAWVALDLDVYESLTGHYLPVQRRWSFLVAWAARELMALPIWVLGMAGNEVEWRGKRYRILRNGETARAEPRKSWWSLIFDGRKRNYYEQLDQEAVLINEQGPNLASEN
ncbi:hypothetical protein EW145_g1517 [Phellinidium pouzarii]|uniref:Ceramide glucosyltransferase n=1 Tax=Phellinidium pouzarii TaxID=167371 RepID=A0A4S4LEQ7_9AGAM|nr:hypothetical protein EW145_g1517 [Phellinidium pouzarii]